MCRSIGAGGRRCPASHDVTKIAARNKRRREKYAQRKMSNLPSEGGRVFSLSDFTNLLEATPALPSDTERRVSRENILLPHVPVHQLIDELMELVEQDESLWKPREDQEVHVESSGNILRMTIEGDDEFYELAYVDLNSGFMFFGDDPENGMRDDLTFPITFGTFEKADDVADAYTQLKALAIKHREAKDWANDLESMKFAYRSFGHFSINEQLRTGRDINPEIKNLLDGLTKDKLEKDVTVYRGIHCNAETRERILEQIKTHGTISDEGLVSTSLSPHIAKNFAGDGGLVVSIPLKEGQKCWDARTIDREQELLLPSDQVFEGVTVYDLTQS